MSSIQRHQPMNQPTAPRLAGHVLIEALIE